MISARLRQHSKPPSTWLGGLIGTTLAWVMTAYLIYSVVMILIRIIWTCGEEEFELGVQRELRACHYNGARMRALYDTGLSGTRGSDDSSPLLIRERRRTLSSRRAICRSHLGDSSLVTAYDDAYRIRPATADDPRGSTA